MPLNEKKNNNNILYSDIGRKMQFYFCMGAKHEEVIFMNNILLYFRISKRLQNTLFYNIVIIIRIIISLSILQYGLAIITAMV